MKSEFQALTGVIRGGSQYQKFGDPYEFVCTVQICGDDAHIVGAVSSEAGRLSIAARSSINDVLWDMGVRTVSWERARGKSVRGKVKPPRPPSVRCEHGLVDPSCYYCLSGES